MDQKHNYSAAFRSALIAAGVGLLLFIPLAGLRTVIAPGGLTIAPNILPSFIACGIIFLVKFGNDLRAFPIFPCVNGLLLLCIGGLPYLNPALQPAIPGFLQVSAIFAGVYLLFSALYRFLRSDTPTEKPREAAADVTAAMRSRAAEKAGIKGWFAKYQDRLQHGFIIFLIVFAMTLPFMPFAGRGVMDAAIQILIYALLAWGLNITVGLAGQLDLGYVAFYAIGAYAYAIIAQNFDLGFYAALPFAILAAVVAALIIGGPVLRLRGDYFAIVTLGFGEIVRQVVINWQSLTGGSEGITRIPRPSFFGIAEFTRRARGDLPAFHDVFGLDFSSSHRIIFVYFLALILAFFVNWLSINLRKLPLGRAWEAQRENEIACQALGMNGLRVKLAAYAIAAGIGAVAGALFAAHTGFVSPEGFNFLQSAIILAIVVLGGMGSQLGILIAAILLIGLPEMFRDLAQYRMLAFGAAMVLIMIWKPRGLLSKRLPTVTINAIGKGKVA